MTDVAVHLINCELTRSDSVEGWRVTVVLKYVQLLLVLSPQVLVTVEEITHFINKSISLGGYLAVAWFQDLKDLEDSWNLKDQKDLGASEETGELQEL